MNCPLLKIDFHWLLQRASALLWLAKVLSIRRARLRRLAAAAPGPITSSRPCRSLAWALTPTRERVYFKNAVVNASSASSVCTCPLLPFWGLATCTLDTARWWIRLWRWSDPSQMAPTTIPPWPHPICHQFAAINHVSIDNFATGTFCHSPEPPPSSICWHA